MKYETIIGDSLDIARQLLGEDECVAIPTETVYGLAANAYSPNAVQKIFSVKNRPLYNPLIVHVGNMEQLLSVVAYLPDAAIRLLSHFSPGPLTLLLPKNDIVPDIVTSGLPDVAVRIPAHPLTLALLRSINFPLAAPSANPFGYISPTKAAHVKDMLDTKIPYVLDGGDCTEGIESTIVGFREGVPVVFRQGVITKEDIENCVGLTYQNESKKPVSPGMLDSHYSPHTPLYLTDDIESMIRKFGTEEIGLITYNEYYDALPTSQQIILYEKDDIKMGASKLYASLHEMDSKKYKAIIVKKLPDTGIGLSINDRLWRASRK